MGTYRALLGPTILLCCCTLSMDRDGKISVSAEAEIQCRVQYGQATLGARYCHDKYVRDSKIWLRGTLVQIKYILREVWCVLQEVDRRQAAGQEAALFTFDVSSTMLSLR